MFLTYLFLRLHTVCGSWWGQEEMGKQRVWCDDMVRSTACSCLETLRALQLPAARHSFLFYLYNNLICVDKLDLKWLPNCYLCSQEPWQTSFKLTIRKCSQLKEERCISLPAKHPWQAFLWTILICFHLIKEHFPALWLLSLPEVVPITEMNKYFSTLVSTCLVICYAIGDL